jgi:hypothetical protein
MSVRTALNLTYHILCEGRDEKQRRELDAELYGWGDMNKRAEADLWRDSGGEG